MRNFNSIINKLKSDLEKLKQKAPRSGVKQTKVFKDKTKYTRKKKHKGKEE